MPDNFKDYIFSYRFQGAQWGFTIKAASPQDAIDRVKALSFAHYDGEVVATIPYTPGMGFIVRFVVWLRNLWRFTNEAR